MLSEVVLPRPGAAQRIAPPPPATAGGVRPGILAALLGVIGFAVAAAGSWIPSLWGDEAASIMSAERSWPSLFAMLGHVDSVHAGYYVFLHGWIDVFGASAFSVRLPSAIATGLATAGIVLLVHRLGGARLAVVSGIVYMIIPRVSYIGIEARDYAFTATCAVWLTVLLVHLVRTRSHSRLAWAAYGLAVTVCVYYFLYLALMLLVHAAIALSVTRDRRLLRRLAISGAAGLLLAGPAIYFDLSEAGQISFLSTRTTVDAGIFFVDQWFWSVPLAVAAWLCIGAACWKFIARWVHDRRCRRANTRAGVAEALSPSFAVVAVAWCAIPVALLLSMNLVHAVYTARYVSFVTPAVAMLIAAGLCMLPRRWMLITALAAVVALAAPDYLSQRGPYGMPSGSDWSQVAATVGANAQPGDAIVFSTGDSPSLNPRSAKYLYPQGFIGLDDVTLVTPHAQTTGLWDVTESVTAAAPRLADGDGRVWLVADRGPGEPAHPRELRALEALGFRVVSVVPENVDVVYLLERTPSA